MRENIWRFRLYVAGAGPRSMAALRNLRAICAEHFRGTHEIEVVDLAHDASPGGVNEITVVPTLVVSAPLALRRIAGDLSDTQSILATLRNGARPLSPSPVV